MSAIAGGATRLSEISGKIGESSSVCAAYLRQLIDLEIDIMGLENKSTAIFAECKWTHEKVDLKVLETLIRRSHLFPIPRTHYFLFAKNGFTNGCQDKAHQLGNVTLVGYEEILATLSGANE